MSERKSFAEILKENLNNESFKQPLKPPKQKTIETNLLIDPYKKEVYEYFIDIKELSKIHSSRTFYAKLFRNPVKTSFYWCEEDWQGSIFAIYEYSGKFISVKGGFGSCQICDGLPNSQERLDKIFSHLMFNENINDINIHGNHPEYTHPELISKFNTWKMSFAPRQHQIEKEIKQVEEIKHVEEIVKVEQIVKVEEIKQVKKTWAEIISKKN